MSSNEIRLFQQCVDAYKEAVATAKDVKSLKMEKWEIESFLLHSENPSIRELCISILPAHVSRRVLAQRERFEMGKRRWEALRSLSESSGRTPEQIARSLGPLFDYLTGVKDGVPIITF